MALKNLKLILKKNSGSSSSEEFITKNSNTKIAENEETEVTLTEEDEAKYGYNDYGDQGRSTCSPADEYSRLSASPAPHQRMPRRSSLRGSNGPRRRARRHSLTFSNDVVVATITPTKKLAKKKSNLWFNEKEYDQMQNEIHLIAESAKEGQENKYCTRGLEGIIKRESKNRRYASWDAVLDEQDAQRDSGMEYYDEEAIGKSYQKVSAESSAEAMTRALQDEKEVAEYLSETRKFLRRMSM